MQCKTGPVRYAIVSISPSFQFYSFFIYSFFWASFIFPSVNIIFLWKFYQLYVKTWEDLCMNKSVGFVAIVIGFRRRWAWHFHLSHLSPLLSAVTATTSAAGVAVPNETRSILPVGHWFSSQPHPGYHAQNSTPHKTPYHPSPVCVSPSPFPAVFEKPGHVCKCWPRLTFQTADAAAAAAAAATAARFSFGPLKLPRHPVSGGRQSVAVDKS